MQSGEQKPLSFFTFGHPTRHGKKLYNGFNPSMKLTQISTLLSGLSKENTLTTIREKLSALCPLQMFAVPERGLRHLLNADHHRHNETKDRNSNLLELLSKHKSNLFH